MLGLHAIILHYTNIFMIFHDISMNCLVLYPNWQCTNHAITAAEAANNGATHHTGRLLLKAWLYDLAHRKIMKNPRGVSNSMMCIHIIYIHIFTYTRKNISMMVGLFIASLGWSEGSIFLDFSQKSVPNL
jgi:hypothetical protein